MSGLSREALDNGPTPERIRHMGRERWQPSQVNQQVRRPYARSRPAIEVIVSKANLHADSVSALSQLRTYMHGARRDLGLVSSYGEQRWNGTTLGQALGSMVTEEWPIYCGQRVSQAERRVDDRQQWCVLVLVLYDDLLLTEAGKRLGSSNDEAARKRAARLFYAAVPKVLECANCYW